MPGITDDLPCGEHGAKITQLENTIGDLREDQRETAKALNSVARTLAKLEPAIAHLTERLAESSTRDETRLNDHSKRISALEKNEASNNGRRAAYWAIGGLLGGAAIVQMLQSLFMG